MSFEDDRVGQPTRTTVTGFIMLGHRCWPSYVIGSSGARIFFFFFFLFIEVYLTLILWMFDIMYILLNLVKEDILYYKTPIAS